MTVDTPAGAGATPPASTARIHELTPFGRQGGTEPGLSSHSGAFRARPVNSVFGDCRDQAHAGRHAANYFRNCVAPIMTVTVRRAGHRYLFRREDIEAELERRRVPPRRADPPALEPSANSGRPLRPDPP